VIRFTYKPTEGVEQDTHTERVSIRVGEHASIDDALEAFKGFCLAVGYLPESWKQAISEENERLGK